MTWKLTSPAFENGQRIPAEFTCEGTDISPELNWSTPPESTLELVLIMDDPDAPMGTWTHWLIYAMSPALTSLPENVEKSSTVASIQAKQGITSFRRPGYGGPCPPPGPDHRYFFRLYAVDTATNLPPDASKAELEKAIQGHVIGKAELMGTYSR
ncbi:MAG TPA: YbhB/YbcL family Raf kinase inhibitor-like protein [bacterium]|nr:YbhB/YbcL family Raf kinase inhibitor-like protein [bacterium]